MTIRRRCTERNCKNGRRCLEHLRFDVMFRGKRYRIPANEFAIPRMELGKQREIQSMEEARDWERLFIGEIKAGRNPRRPSARTMQAGSELRDVSAFLDAYMERCVKPAGLRSIAAIRSWETCQIGIPGATAKDKENRRIRSIRRGGSRRFSNGERCSAPTRSCSAAPAERVQPNIQTAWETLRLLANGIEPKPGREDAQWNREQLERIDLRWHDLRHEGACRLLADRVASGSFS